MGPNAASGRAFVLCLLWAQSTQSPPAAIRNQNYHLLAPELAITNSRLPNPIPTFTQVNRQLHLHVARSNVGHRVISLVDFRQ